MTSPATAAVPVVFPSRLRKVVSCRLVVRRSGGMLRGRYVCRRYGGWVGSGFRFVFGGTEFRFLLLCTCRAARWRARSKPLQASRARFRASRARPGRWRGSYARAETAELVRACPASVIVHISKDADTRARCWFFCCPVVKIGRASSSFVCVHALCRSNISLWCLQNGYGDIVIVGVGSFLSFFDADTKLFAWGTDRCPPSVFVVS